MPRILVINPGSTSTKIAVYDNQTPVFTYTIHHSPEELAGFSALLDQFGWRKDLVENAVKQNGVSLDSIDAVIGRGGIICPVESGTYEVNDAMVHDLVNAPMQHASNLGALIARDIAGEIGVKAYIADPVVVDEMIPYARLSGVPELPRTSIFHALNQKAIARRYARETGHAYEDLNLIVCHMGGGITVSAHRHGRVIDTTNALDGCGPFSPERSGSLPPGPLVKLCFSGKYTEDELIRMVHGKGGMMAHLGITSVPDALERIEKQHDLHAMLVVRAMLYTVCKEIGAMAVALKGNVDAILLTGGMAHSRRITDFMADQVSFIAPIYVYPGEDELKSLAENCLAVLNGDQQVKVYRSEPSEDPSQINDRDKPSKLRDILLAATNTTVEGTLSAIRRYFGSWKMPAPRK